MIRRTIHFVGRVQGVGFRYTVVRLSRHVQVAGHVQNLPDGRVRLVAEGQAEQLDDLLALILAEMGHHIDRHHVDESACTGQFGQPRPGGIVVQY